MVVDRSLLIALLALPNLIWQYQHHFPTWVDLNNVKRMHKNVVLPPALFIWQQIMILNPASALVWIAGLGFLLFHRDGKRYRFLGFTYLLFLAIMMALKAKDYYLSPIYPMLFAAGGVFWEKLTERRGMLWARAAVSAAVIILGASGITPHGSDPSRKQDCPLRRGIRNQNPAHRGSPLRPAPSTFRG